MNFQKQLILEKVDAIEAEMKRIGFWDKEEPKIKDDEMYGGVSFENWLQFDYLPKVKKYAKSILPRRLPPYRVGLAALRQYDYHSVVEEALPLVRICNELEQLLPQK